MIKNREKERKEHERRNKECARSAMLHQSQRLRVGMSAEGKKTGRATRRQIKNQGSVRDPENQDETILSASGNETRTYRIERRTQQKKISDRLELKRMNINLKLQFTICRSQSNRNGN